MYKGARLFPALSNNDANKATFVWGLQTKAFDIKFIKYT